MKIDYEAYKKKLLAERERLLRTIQLEEGERLDLSVAPGEGDEADRSLAANLREFTFTRVDIDQQRLRQVEAALDRLRHGDYGDCLNCGEPIAPKRLEAIPWAMYCVRCQELYEKGLLQEQESPEHEAEEEE